MLARLAATLPLIVAGCGDNTSTGPASGNRLALTGFVYEDGTVQPDPSTFHDLARAEDCTLEPWSDGATHCTPATGELGFLDPGCSIPALIGEPYARVPFTSSDPRISRLRVAGGLAGTGGYYRLGDTGCELYQTAQPIYVVSDTELGADDFVRVRRLPDGGPGRLAVVRARSDDGLSAPIGFHDTMLDLDCAARSAPGAASTECAPVRATAPSYYADATCTTVTATRASTANADAIETILDGCPVDLAFGGGADYLFDGTPDHCVQATGYSPADFVIAGAALALAPLPRTIGSSTSRFALIANDVLVHDNQRGIDCAPSQGRCLPPIGTTYLSPLFRDAECTTAVMEAYVATKTCGTTLAYATDGARYFSVGAVDGDPLYTISTSEICAPVLPVPGFTPHLLGPVVPLEMFGTVTHVVL